MSVGMKRTHKNLSTERFHRQRKDAALDDF
jgi:hypothetical protein